MFVRSPLALLLVAVGVEFRTCVSQATILFGNVLAVQVWLVASALLGSSVPDARQLFATRRSLWTDVGIALFFGGVVRAAEFSGALAALSVVVPFAKFLFSGGEGVGTVRVQADLLALDFIARNIGRAVAAESVVPTASNVGTGSCGGIASWAWSLDT